MERRTYITMGQVKLVVAIAKKIDLAMRNVEEYSRKQMTYAILRDKRQSAKRLAIVTNVEEIYYKKTRAWKMAHHRLVNALSKLAVTMNQ